MSEKFRWNFNTCKICGTGINPEIYYTPSSAREFNYECSECGQVRITENATKLITGNNKNLLQEYFKHYKNAGITPELIDEDKIKNIHTVLDDVRKKYPLA
jgi:translation initiation factor 2 beta subunit (eIF-2beta)/eIF-5